MITNEVNEQIDKLSTNIFKDNKQLYENSKSRINGEVEAQLATIIALLNPKKDETRNSPIADDSSNNKDPKQSMMKGDFFADDEDNIVNTNEENNDGTRVGS